MIGDKAECGLSASYVISPCHLYLWNKSSSLIIHKDAYYLNYYYRNKDLCVWLDVYISVCLYVGLYACPHLALQTRFYSLPKEDGSDGGNDDDQNQVTIEF